jgi:hypothetical protein
MRTGYTWEKGRKRRGAPGERRFWLFHDCSYQRVASRSARRDRLLGSLKWARDRERLMSTFGELVN